MTLRNWNRSPWDGEYNPITITDEPYTVGYDTALAQYGIRLNSAPLRTESSGNMTIKRVSDSTELTEVSRTIAPSAGEYRVDYEADTYLGTGWVQMNASDNGLQVLASYQASGDVIKGGAIPELDEDNTFTGNNTFTGAVSGAGFPNMVVFTSSGTWNVPTGITRALVTVVGGGGGGCRVVQGGGGGSGGGVSIGIVTGLSGSETITVGSGGAGGTGTGATGDVGDDGAASSFGSHITAPGGRGATTRVGASSPVVGADGDINYTLGDGHNAALFSTSGAGTYLGGNGGGPGGGRGGFGTLGATALGRDGSAPGAGGGGGGANDSLAAEDAGDGADGIVIIRY